MIELQPILTAIGAGIFYSLYWYLNKVVDPTKPETWKSIDPWPVLATAVTGAAIGIISVLYGSELTQVSVEIQLASYMAFTAVIERGMKTIWNIIQVRYMAPKVA